mmetsp:Transcript_8906/g.24676  ORF Transcript_8906/g.24676 Transcript_8906/m.24676 type:complete len:488 (+) Transcript_8906:89-1552(+)
MGWEKQMRKAKRLHRPSLRNWESDGLYHTFPDFQEEMLGEKFQDSVRNNSNNSSISSSGSFQSSTVGIQAASAERRRQRDYEAFIPDEKNTPVAAESVPMVLDARTLTTQDFWDNYEGKEIPCVIRNIPQGYEGGQRVQPWQGLRSWPLETLRYDAQLRNRVFKCGEDDDGRSIKVKLKHFLRYQRSTKDDSPLYIFDSAFEDDRVSKRILQEYSVPVYFRDDLFRFISEQRRPPYRWFLVGPERSGTTIHIDPLATNAWNTLIQGAKRWVLFPPHVPKNIIKGRGLVRRDEDDEAIHYFMFILPRIKRKASAVIQLELKTHGTVPDTSPYKNFCCYEFTQYAGETVFVPNGWWHAVLNLTDTVAVTQNYCSERNFEKSWIKTREGRKRMAWKLLQQLDSRPEYQHLAQRARAMNERDGHVMKYDPVQIAKREERARLENAKKKQQKEGEESTSDDDDSSSNGDEEGGNNGSQSNDRRRKKQRRRMM